jgi:hypothetical protein
LKEIATAFGLAMTKNQMKLAIIAVMVLLIGGLAYAKKDKAAEKAGKECKKEAAAEVKKCKAKTEKEAEKAGKECKKEAEKARKESAGKAEEAGAAGEKKESFFDKLLGRGKDHQQQLKALDVKAAKTKVKSDEKIAAQEKELAEAKAANDTEKAAKIEKKIAKEKEKLEKEMKKIEDKSAKIKAEAAKKE